MRQEGLPLYALESGDPVKDFDLIGFSLGYELAYTNVLNMLDLAGLPLRSADRIAVLRGGKLLCCDTPEAVYAGGTLDEVFGVSVHRMDTPHGPQYYCVAKEAL